MQILEHGILFSGKDDPALTSCCFPSMCRLHDGTLLASFKGAARKNPDNKTDHAMTCFSYDGGKTWTAPVEIFAPPVVDGNKTTLRTIYYVEVEPGNLLAVANAVDATLEDLPYYNEETEGLKNTYIVAAHSADNGRTWTEPVRIQVQTFYDAPLPLTGAPFLTADGRVAIQFEVNKPYYETAYWVHHSAVVYSEDGGYTWGNEVIITNDPDRYYWDQRIDTLSDGRVVDIFWVFDRNVGDYVNIHCCESTDGGRTFGPLQDTGLVGQPGNVVDGPDGSMLAIYINRDAAPIIKLAQSFDGKTWKDVLTVFEFAASTKGKQNAGMNDVWAEMAKFNVGHPYLEYTKDGTLWAYYYNGPTTDRTDLCFARIEL